MVKRNAAAGFSRSDRVAGQIRRDIALLIRNEVKDPRLGMVTVLEVSVSKDLTHAKVWFDTLNAEQGKEAEAILNQAAGFLRHELGRGLKLRVTPNLHFFYDESQARGAALSELIDRVIAEDQQAQQADHNTADREQD